MKKTTKAIVGVALALGLVGSMAACSSEKVIFKPEAIIPDIETRTSAGE